MRWWRRWRKEEVEVVEEREGRRGSGVRGGRRGGSVPGGRWWWQTVWAATSNSSNGGIGSTCPIRRGLTFTSPNWCFSFYLFYVELDRTGTCHSFCTSPGEMDFLDTNSKCWRKTCYLLFFCQMVLVYIMICCCCCCDNNNIIAQPLVSFSKKILLVSMM